MIAKGIEFSDKPVTTYFTGLRGSGKSTELLRLADRLKRKTGQSANLLPVFIDADEVLDISNPIDIPDVLIAILYGTEVTILKAEGTKDDVARDKACKEGILTRLWNWLTNTSVELKAIEVGVEGAKALIEMKTLPSVREKVQEQIAKSLPTFLETVAKEMKGLDARAKKLRHAGLFVVLDSLEKLRGVSTNWVQVMESAERMFVGDAPYLDLPVHVVYTIPPALVLRVRRKNLHYIPMIKLHEQGDKQKRFGAGYEAAREIVTSRIPSNDLARVFGGDHEKLVEKLVIASGGYPREIVRLLRICVAEAPVTGTTFDRIVQTEWDAYRRMVPREAHEWLAQLSLNHGPPAYADAKTRELVDLMFQDSFILRYQNNSEWYDLHPALDDHLPIREAVARRAAAKATVSAEKRAQTESPAGAHGKS